MTYPQAVQEKKKKNPYTQWMAISCTIIILEPFGTLELSGVKELFKYKVFFKGLRKVIKTPSRTLS